ncbi:MAG: hypothetical protein MN733_34770 [Nitrososphaera sp.]|nr:hypothetical protein [Nitrososphaera sp.]
MLPHKKAFASKVANLVGYYIPGDTPTVIDPRLSLNHDTGLTSVHENAHRALINNTLYGFLLVRLYELGTSKMLSQPYAELFTEHFDKLSGNIHDCAEGSATVHELLIASSSDTQLIDIISHLPAEYVQACLPFGAVLPLRSAFKSNLSWAHFAQPIVQALAEYTVDSPFYKLDALPPSFASLVNYIVNVPQLPDQLLSLNANLFHKIDWRRLARTCMKLHEDFRAAKPTMRAMRRGDWAGHLAYATQVSLRTTEAIKRELFLADFSTSSAPYSWTYDDLRTIKANYDNGLRLKWPQLEDLDVLPSPMVTVELQNPVGYLEEVQVEPEMIIHHLEAVSAQPGFCSFVIRIFYEQSINSYRFQAGSTRASDLTMERIDFATRYLASSVPADMIKEIDCVLKNKQIVWVSYLFSQYSDTPCDLDLLSSLAAQVYVYCQVFNMELIEILQSKLPGNKSITIYSIAPKGLMVMNLNAGNLNVFFIVPDMFYDNFTSVHGIPIGREDNLPLPLSLAVAVVMRSDGTS